MISAGSWLSELTRLLDHAALTEAVDRRAVIAEHLAQDFVRVLAGCRNGADPPWCLRELDRHARHVHLTRERIVHLHEHLALPEVRVLGHLGNRAHRTDGNPRLAERRADLVDGVRGAPRLHEGPSAIADAAPRQWRGVPLVAADDRHQVRGHLPAGRADDDPAILGAVWWATAFAALRACGEVVRRRDLHHGEGRIEQTHVHDLAFARAITMAERRERTDGSVERRVAIDHRRGRAERLAHRLARQRHEPAHRLAERIEGGPVRVWAVLPESRHRDEDDARIDGAQSLVLEAHRPDDAGPEVLEHDVRLLHQRGENVLALRAPEVEAQALLAAVVDGEVDALTAHHRRMSACLLAAERLHLDDFGAEVGQDHAAAWPGLIAGQLEDAHAVERDAHFAALGENLYTVVEVNFCPGFSTVVGKFGLLGESGKCCVSRHTASRKL